MSKYQASRLWLLTDKILAVMREHKLTYQVWAAQLEISPQRLHMNVTGRCRGKAVYEKVLLSLGEMTGRPTTDFYKEEG